MAKLVSILVIISLIQCSLGDINNNEIEDGLVETVSNILGSNNNNNKGGPDLGMLLSNFITSDSAKQMGQMLLGNGAAGSAAGDILQGIGSMISNKEGGGGGLDLSMVSTILNMMNSNSHDHGHHEEKKNQAGFDFSSAIALANSFVKQDGSNDMLSFLPTLLELFSALFGPESEERAKEHAGHSWFLPPIVEKMHVVFDIVMNSKIGRDIVKKLGAQKFVSIFSDETGNFSYKKFVEMLENHQFRAHWIKMVTSRIADVLSYVADPYTQQKYVKTVYFFVNNVLLSQGLPQRSQFDPNNPADSIVGIVKFFTMKYINIEIDVGVYVIPIVNYIQDLLRLAEHKGLLGRGIDSSELTHKLTDTINFEIIEPIARVNRALRFASKEPKCTKYVLCVANKADPNEKLSLPGLKNMLSKGVTLAACWYLSGHEHMDFWSLYGAVTKGSNCKFYHHEVCQGFHLEESKAREAYVHNEL